MSYPYEELNKAWKTTCKVLFKEEIGELKDYEGWLIDFQKFAVADGRHLVKEYKNRGKPVKVFSYYYHENSRFVDFSKLGELKVEPLSMDEIKDIDSIANALKERFYYLSNVVLGKSEYVEGDSIINSYFVYDSYAIEDSSYIAHSI